MDCNLYLKNNEHKEFKAFGLKQSFPSSLLVLKYFLYVSDMKKKKSTKLENPEYTNVPPPTKRLGGRGWHDREGLREWEKFIEKEIKVPPFSWITARYPKARFFSKLDLRHYHLAQGLNRTSAFPQSQTQIYHLHKGAPSSKNSQRLL